MDTTSITAMIGAFTGTLSLGICAWQVHQSWPKVKLILPSYEGKTNAYFFDANKLEDNNLKPYRAYIQVQIFNNSSVPIHIVEFHLNICGIGTFVSNEFSEPKDVYEFYVNENQYEKVNMKKHQLKPIFEMPPFSAKEGIIFFPRIDDLTNDRYKAKITIKTSRKDFKTEEITILRRKCVLSYIDRDHSDTKWS